MYGVDTTLLPVESIDESNVDLLEDGEDKAISSWTYYKVYAWLCIIVRESIPTIMLQENSNLIWKLLFQRRLVYRIMRIYRLQIFMQQYKMLGKKIKLNSN